MNSHKNARLTFARRVEMIQVTTHRGLAISAAALSKEVTPKGAHVVRVSPGWVETEAAVALARRLATQAGTDYEGGKQIIMQSLGAFNSAGRPNRRKSPTSSPFCCRRALRRLGLQQLMQHGFVAQRLDPGSTQDFRPRTGHAVQAQALEGNDDVTGHAVLENRTGSQKLGATGTKNARYAAGRVKVDLIRGSLGEPEFSYSRP